MQLILPVNRIEDFISTLISDYPVVIGPVEKHSRYIFSPVDDPAQVRLDYDSTLLPPVRWIYPNNEILIEFDMERSTSTPVIQSRNQVLLFIHPCDVNAITMMDEIMAEEPEDINYLHRRESTLIIAYECLAPCKENILCFDKGYHIASRGYDLFFTHMEDIFFVEVSSEKGEEIVKKYAAFKKAGYNEKQALQRVREKRERDFKKSLKGDVNILSHLLKEAYNDKIWEEEGAKCLSCGACNIVCPTCYCFDIFDDLCADMNRGIRARRWDGCQLEDFCKIASGENFRQTPADRLRHRIFKKEVYLKKRFGWSGCVGCGRCIDHCIAGISIINIFNYILERKFLSLPTHTERRY